MNGSRASKIGRSVAAMGATLVAAGCTGGVAPGTGDSARSQVSYATSVCPPSVDASATRTTTCGFLTVPQDRSDPDGRQIRVFVVRLAGDPGTDAPPVVFVGDDIGSSFDPLALTGMADHLNGPEVIAIQARGTGFSEPNLSCPEVESLAPAALAAPSDDPDLRQAFIEAVRACHDRFVDQGVDLSAYGMQEARADLVDLVQALGLDRWDAISKGSTSRVLFEAIRSDPTTGLRAVVLYNPDFPDTDPLVQAVESTRTSVATLGELCEADPRCAGRFPDLSSSFDAAIERFDEHPRTIMVSGTKVQVDGARLLRDLRNLLAMVTSEEQMYLHLPATIHTLAHGSDPASSLAAAISPELSAPTLCTGYLPVCGTDVSQGAYYSALCEAAPAPIDPDAFVGSNGTGSAWATAFGDTPYLDACDAWDVQPADRSVTEPLSSDVPMLIYSGGLDPFVSPEVARAGVARLPNAFLVINPAASVPVLAIADCPDDNSRNEFLADPTSPPNTRCLERVRPTFATSPL